MISGGGARAPLLGNREGPAPSRSQSSASTHSAGTLGYRVTSARTGAWSFPAPALPSQPIKAEMAVGRLACAGRAAARLPRPTPTRPGLLAVRERGFGAGVRAPERSAPRPERCLFPHPGEWGGGGKREFRKRKLRGERRRRHTHLRALPCGPRRGSEAWAAPAQRPWPGGGSARSERGWAEGASSPPAPLLFKSVFFFTPPTHPFFSALMFAFRKVGFPRVAGAPLVRTATSGAPQRGFREAARWSAWRARVPAPPPNVHGLS